MQNYDLKRKTHYQGLDKLPVYIYDQSATSDKYFGVTDLPAQFSAGKNVFKLSGSVVTLLKNSHVRVELLDSLGKPIYLEYNKYTDRLGRIYITAYIYPDTAPGLGTLTIVGVATLDVTSPDKVKAIPYDWAESINVKWQKSIKIEPLERNNSEIVFVNEPTVQVSEIFKKYNYLNYVDGAVRGAKISGSPTEFRYTNEQFKSSVPKNQDSFNTQYRPAEISRGSITNMDLTAFKADYQLTTNEFRRASTDVNDLTEANLTIQKQISSPGGLAVKDITTANSPASGTALITSTNVTWSRDMVGGILYIDASEIKSSVAKGIGPKVPDGYSIPTSIAYNAKISQIVDTHTIRVTPPYSTFMKLNSNPNGDFINYNPSDFIFSSTSVTYSADISYTESEAYKNIAHIELSNLIPIAGDIYSIRTYAKSKSDISDYKLVSENVLGGKALLLDTSSAEYNLPTGDIISTAHLRTYWTSSVVDWVSGETAILHSTDVLFNSLRIGRTGYSGSGQIVVYPTMPNLDYSVSSSKANKLEFIEGNTYEFVANIIYDSSGSTMLDTVTGVSMSIHMSGSAFDPNFTLYRAGVLPGPSSLYWIKTAKIGELSVSSRFSRKNFNRLSFRFTPTRTGTALPAIIANGGYWYLSDIQINSLRETGFNPTFTTIDVPINPLWDNDLLDFKFEFLDYEGKACDQYLYSKNIPFKSGSATYTQGAHNLLTGSQYIGNAIGTGIEMSGKNSGYIRSIGYEGWNGFKNNESGPGFFIWSGSITLGSGSSPATAGVTPTTYTGVGIELIADSGSFKFKTTPSEFEVITDKFFFGRPDLQYISGSNGLLEISSSHFFVMPNGDFFVGDSGSYMSYDAGTGTLTINANSIYVTSSLVASSSISAQSISVSSSISASEINVSSSFTHNYNILETAKSFEIPTGNKDYVVFAFDSNVAYWHSDIDMSYVLDNDEQTVFSRKYIDAGGLVKNKPTCYHITELGTAMNSSISLSFSEEGSGNQIMYTIYNHSANSTATSSIRLVHRIVPINQVSAHRTI